MTAFLAAWALGALPVLLAERVHARSHARRCAADREREYARWQRLHVAPLSFGETLAASDDVTAPASARGRAA